VTLARREESSRAKGERGRVRVRCLPAHQLVQGSFWSQQVAACYELKESDICIYMSLAGIRSLAPLLKAAGMAISSPRPKQFSIPPGALLFSSWVLGLEISQGKTAARTAKTCCQDQ